MARTTPTPEATATPIALAPPDRKHLLVHMKPDAASLPKDVLLARRPFIEKAAEFSAGECERDPALALAKWLRVLHGLKSPCTLVDPEMWLGSVTNWCATRKPRIFLDPLQGWIRVPTSTDRSQEYRVKLPDLIEGEPSDLHCFLLCIKRYGQMLLGEATAQTFWSHNVVILETEEVDPQAAGMAFVFSLQVGRDNDGLLMYEKAGMYIDREPDPSRRTGSRITGDRTDGLQIPTNFMGIVTECARDLGFPLEEARVNRRTVQEQQEARMMAQARALTPSSPLLTPTGNGTIGGRPAIANPFTRRD